MPRLDDSEFRIFISHKHYDDALARVTKETLETLIPKRMATTRISCFVSGVDIPSATDWKRKIKAELARSHLLVLLFTNPSDGWDWCLYETGLFTRFDREDIQSVVCLFEEGGSTASPISNLQGVPVTQDRIKRFLSRLCHETHEVADDWRKGGLAASKVSDQRLSAAADKIVAAFNRSVGAEDDVYHPCHRLVLDLTGTGAEAMKRIPPAARINEEEGQTSAYTLSLFGLGPRPGRPSHTWKEVLDYLGATRSPWRKQLDEAYRNALNEQLFTPVRAPLTAWDPEARVDRYYKPVLYGVRRHGESRRPVEVTILFDRFWDDRDD